MEFLAGYDSDKESDEEAQQESGRKNKDLMPQSLPSPNELLNKSSKSSIFKKASDDEIYQTKILEKHVKMVENLNNLTEVNGKKVCWMYRQGRCRAGKKCSMFHDSELRNSASRSQETDTGFEVNQINSASFQYFEECDKQALDNDDDVERVRKKRYGVSDKLEPPKKALKQIRDIQVKEKTSRK